MNLLILLLLTLLPLLGVLYIVVYGSPTTVDGLFMSLILLAIAGIVGMNALYELRKGKSGTTATGSSPGRFLSSGGLVRRGKVREVVFFESNVGQPNKSVVTLSDGGGAASQMLVIEGDARNALPVGQNVEITMRKDGAQNVNVLVSVSYS